MADREPGTDVRLAILMAMRDGRSRTASEVSLMPELAKHRREYSVSHQMTKLQALGLLTFTGMVGTSSPVKTWKIAVDVNG